VRLSDYPILVAYPPNLDSIMTRRTRVTTSYPPPPPRLYQIQGIYIYHGTHPNMIPSSTLPVSVEYLQLLHFQHSPPSNIMHGLSLLRRSHQMIHYVNMLGWSELQRRLICFFKLYIIFHKRHCPIHTIVSESACKGLSTVSVRNELRSAICQLTQHDAWVCSRLTDRGE
jgi:hypothetical protein